MCCHRSEVKRIGTPLTELATFNVLSLLRLLHLCFFDDEAVLAGGAESPIASAGVPGERQ